MASEKWHQGRLVGLDTETDGTDPHAARIVTAAVVHFAPGERPRPIEWIIDPGREIPAEAAAVHGWTRDRVLATVGGPGKALRITQGSHQTITADGALFEIAAHAASAMGREVPLIVHNAAYDLTLLEAELARNQIDTLMSRPAGIRGVIDTMVIEKQLDPYRKSCYKAPGCRPEDNHHECGGCRGSKVHSCGGCGSTDRTLTSLCRHYGIIHAGAHGASTDAVAAVRLVPKLVGLWPQIGTWKLGTLHSHQVTWRKSQSDGLRDFWRRTGDERWREVSSDWPLQLAPVAPPVGAGAR